MNSLLKTWVREFDKSEVENVECGDFSKLIEHHRNAINKLEAIKEFEKRKSLKIESINGFAGTFPELRAKYVNEIDTINRCINRIFKSYKRLNSAQ
jgi:hypothetical protein